MKLAGILRVLARSPLTQELIKTLQQKQSLHLNGLPRFPKGLVASALALASRQGIAQTAGKNLLVVCATLEEASRWAAQLEIMGWQSVNFYPTLEVSPYDGLTDGATDTLVTGSETTWGQLQILADLVTTQNLTGRAIVTTTNALQPHLPSPTEFQPHCIQLTQGLTEDLAHLDQKLAELGYSRVPLVEGEGQFSRRGDILDVFPVAAELPVRLEWFGDQLEQLKEFDPATQRSLDKITTLTLTPTSFQHWFSGDETETRTNPGELVSLLSYLPENTLLAIDELDQCLAHSNKAWEYAETQWQQLSSENLEGNLEGNPERQQLHFRFEQVLAQADNFWHLYLSELVETLPETSIATVNLASRRIPTLPHQFAKLAEMIRQELARPSTTFLVSAQPSRSVSLLQEHDCPAQFVPNPQDYPAIDRLEIQHTPIALKYSGLAELEGFILPTFRLVVVTDREFFGQHSLATPGYVRKRRTAVSQQVDPNKLLPNDYVVHRNYGIGKFLRLESLTINREIREYLVIQYADGLLRVAADQLGTLSRFRTVGEKAPELHRMASKAWENTKSRVRKTIKKLAVDLLELYAKRSKVEGFTFPADNPWQQEMEDSFPYQATPDQLKAVQDIKRDLESDRPMDRLVCGDVGFGKTEVAIRAIFKVVTSGKQVALLAPTTILTQQHYHTLKERFAPYPINIGLLNRFRTPEEKKALLQRLFTGELDIVVGTHALLGKGASFRDLGLLVVDEEQRFGVNHKEKIKALKAQVDVLTLSATPIPRTLYMSLSGVREMSLITTPPPSRRSIKTYLSPYKPEAIRTAIKQELERGGQVFYVVPRIEGIEERSLLLRSMIPGVRIAIAHGQTSPEELEATMLTFSNGDADILICTTIIESGLDIPRVNTILIEDAQRFGLAQLYQLRGRVGRSGVQAYAWFFYPKQSELTEAARQRLRAIQEFTQLGSGYQLATRDMEIRGVGNLLGAEQSGQMEAIGFDLYMEMLQTAIREIQGQEIPQVDDTQIDLNLTAFIPADYIPDLEQKMAAYRNIAASQTRLELAQVQADLLDRYGEIPAAAQQLFRVVELKQLAKALGFSRIKSDSKQHIILETAMEEPAWHLLAENLSDNAKSRLVYSKGAVTARGLAALKPDQQLETLITWLSRCQP